MTKVGRRQFDARLAALRSEHAALIARKNESLAHGNGIYDRWTDPVVTREHVPLSWRYDLDPKRNPRLLERIGVNATFNAGAILHDGRYALVVRVEGNDRKSFFAVAESDNGVDGFCFRSRPVTMPELDEPDTNVYDMRLTAHADGHVYGLFCTERRDNTRPQDPTAARAHCGIARTKDLDHWERLPDLVTKSGQQRNVVLHPEFVDECYALYTRPQDGFIDAGQAGGTCWALVETMHGAVVESETVIDARQYHTIGELKNGPGPAPLRTEHGWLHLAHGVRGTAAGLRYVLYAFLADLDEPWRITHKPAGYLLAPLGEERTGDVSNVVFCNGWIRNRDDMVFIYYASSDTRLQVATSSVERLVDYCLHTPEDGLRSAASVDAINRLIDANEALETGNDS